MTRKNFGTKLDLAVRPGRAVRVLVIETNEGDAAEPASSPRLRAARPVPEFESLREWTENHKKARGAA